MNRSRAGRVQPRHVQQLFANAACSVSVTDTHCQLLMQNSFRSLDPLEAAWTDLVPVTQAGKRWEA